MSVMHRTWWVGVAALVVLLGAGSVRAQQPSLEDRALDAMNDSMAAQVLDVVQQLEAWRKQARDLQQLGKNVADVLNSFPGPNGTDDDFTTWAGKADNLLQNVPQFRDAAAKISQDVQAAKDNNGQAADIAAIYRDGLKQAAIAQALAFADQIEQKMQDRYPQVRQFLNYAAALQAKRAQAQKDLQAAVDLAKQYQDQVFDVVDKLRNPAQTAKDFIQGEIAQLMAQAIKKGDVTFRITARDKNVSPFAKKAGIGIEIVYLDQLKVKATGLYFKKDGTPVLDDLKVDSNLSDVLATAALTKLGDFIPDFGSKSPIKLKYQKFLGFQTSQNGRRGGIQFNLEMGFVEFWPDLKLKADGLVLYTDGHIDFDSKDGLIKVPAIKQVALGTSGLGLYDFTIGLNPSGKKVSIEGDLSTFPGDPQAVHLHGTVYFDIPIKKINFEGDLALLGQTLGTITDGEISPEKLTGTLNIPGNKGAVPVEVLGNGKATFTLDRKALKADGYFTLLNSFREKMKLDMGFNGYGSFEASEELRILGVRANETLSITYSPGFRKVHLEAMASASIDLGVLKPNVSVLVTGDNNRDKPFHVEARALGATVSLDVGDFRQLDAELARALREKLPDMVENSLKEMARWDTQARGALADGEKQLRNELSSAAKQVGLDALRTGNPQVDRFFGDLSQGGKDLGAMMSDQGKRIGGELSQAVRNPLGAVRTGVSDLGHTLGSIFGGGGGGSNDDDLRRQMEERKAQAAQELHDKITRQLKDLIGALNNHPGIHRTPAAQTTGSPGHKVTTKTELHVRFGQAAAGVMPNSSTDAVLAFLIKGSGYHSVKGQQVASAGKRIFDSGVQSGTIEIKGLISKDGGKPRVKINIPKLQHGSSLPAEQLVRDEVQRLVELYLPDALVDGNLRREERRLVLKNNTPENIKVWVQLESRHVSNEHFLWTWQPGRSPGPKSQTYAFLLKPKQTLALNRQQVPTAGKGQSGLSGLFEDQKSLAGRPDVGMLQGRAARVWAESESGATWPGYRTTNLWLVAPDAEGKREYHAEQVGNFTFSLNPAPGPRLFLERVVKFRNDTNRTLTISGQVLTHLGPGPAEWKPLPVLHLEPGHTVAVHHEDGWKVHGTKLRFWAEDAGKTLRWSQHREQPLDLVAAPGYRAEQMGSYLYVFRPLAAPAPGGRK
jgi:hypothetical protein